MEESNTYCCNPKNTCSGKLYPEGCLDVKLTDYCQAQCAFCIEKNNTYCSGKGIDVDSLADLINEHPSKNILLLGGEPLLYKDLEVLLLNISRAKKVYLTTNGICLTKEYVDKYFEMFYCLSGINISVHSSDQKTNDKILGCRGPSLSVLSKQIKRISKACPVRINCNLFKQGVHTDCDILNMCEWAERAGASDLRFCELQGVSKKDGFIEANSINSLKNIFDIPEDPFKFGCLIKDKLPKKDFNVSLKLVCGLVNKEKIKPKNTTGYAPNTNVLYSDGLVSKGWIHATTTKNKEIIVEEGCHGSYTKVKESSANCHGNGGSRSSGC